MHPGAGRRRDDRGWDRPDPAGPAALRLRRPADQRRAVGSDAGPGLPALVRAPGRHEPGAQGIGGSVTAANIATDTFTKQQMDQMTLQYNSNVKAWNITNQANAQEWGLGVEATQDQYAAKNAAIAGDIGAGTTLLGSAAQVGTEGILFGNPATTLYSGASPESVLG